MSSYPTLSIELYTPVTCVDIAALLGPAGWTITYPSSPLVNLSLWIDDSPEYVDIDVARYQAFFSASHWQDRVLETSLGPVVGRSIVGLTLFKDTHRLDFLVMEQSGITLVSFIRHSGRRRYTGRPAPAQGFQCGGA